MERGIKAISAGRPSLVREAGRCEVLKEAIKRLAAEPLLETRQVKTLRPNSVAERELRLFGKYRVLFNIDQQTRVVTIVLVGEKRGDRLIVQGEEFTRHYESHSLE